MTNAEPPFYLQAHWDQYLEGLFDEQNRASVLNWLKRHTSERRVIIVGAGFTLNAQKPTGVKVPLWHEQTQKLKAELNVAEGTSFSDLELPDIYDEHRPRGGKKDLPSVLKELLPDDKLTPGKAHDALWNSNPHAVITTNYLDTTLEKSFPLRFRRVVHDSELSGRWGEDELAPLIYFHGHRSDPNTWTVGRKHYESLEQDKPILAAKVRQLIAEFPVLILGYSLTDPDFHAIYRSTAEAMNSQHPGALALMRPTKGVRLDERKLSEKYWRRIGLSLVTFKRSVWDENPDEAHARFLRLTVKVKKHHHLSAAFKKTKDLEDTPRCLAHNIEVVASTLTGAPGDEPECMAEEHERRSIWRSVLQNAVPQDVLDSAQKTTGDALTSEHARARQANGETVVKHELKTPAINPKKWILGTDVWREQAKDLTSHLRINANETWIIEQLVGPRKNSTSRRKLRQLTREWIQFGFEKDLHSGHEKTLLAAWGILTDSDQSQLGLWKNFAVEYPDLLKALGQRARRKRRPLDTEQTAELKEARSLLLAGDRKSAQDIYQAVVDRASNSLNDTFELQVQAFYAAQGVVESQPLISGDEYREAEEERAKYRELVRVNRWVTRVRELGTTLARERAKSQKQDGFESARMSWSSTPQNLHIELTRAEKLGCPPYWLRDVLLAPLLGSIPDAREELRLRLRYGTEDTGRWAVKAMERGEFEVNRSSPFSISLSLSAVARRKGQTIISTAICDATTRAPRKLENFTQAHQIISREDIPAAVHVAATTLTPERYDEPRLAAMRAVATVSSWKIIRKPIITLVDEVRRSWHGQLYLFHLLPSYPWEHWVRCDDFLNAGGEQLIDLFCRPIHKRVGETRTPFAENVGYALYTLFSLAPDNSFLIRMARNWLRRTAKHTMNERSDLLSATTLLGCVPGSRPGADAIADAFKAKFKKLAHIDLRILVAAAEAKNPWALTGWAHKTLHNWGRSRSWKDEARSRRLGSSEEVIETSALVFLIKHHPDLRPRCRERIFKLLDRTWTPLPEISSILGPEYWGASWGRLLQILMFGGRTRDTNSWQIARFDLVNGVVFNGLPDVAPLHPDCHFLYRAALDASSQAHASVANAAIYSALVSAPFLGNESDQKFAALAMQSATNDVRTSVAHGAAFAAGYWTGLDVKSPILREAAVQTAREFREDPAAIIHRQHQFGLAKGRFAKDKFPFVTECDE